MMNDVFTRTWGARVGPAPGTEYWPTVIAAVRDTHPGFLFLAEAYWDLEWALMQQGFDYCYDKRLYDRLLGGERRTGAATSAGRRRLSERPGPVRGEPRRTPGRVGVRSPAGAGGAPWRR